MTVGICSVERREGALEDERRFVRVGHVILAGRDGKGRSKMAPPCTKEPSDQPNNPYIQSFTHSLTLLPSHTHSPNGSDVAGHHLQFLQIREQLAEPCKAALCGVSLPIAHTNRVVGRG